jgi:hypothetical protein
VNWHEAPAYKIARFITRKIKRFPLPNSFNVSNSINSITDLRNIKFNNNPKHCYFDITNMYTNIPTMEVICITKEILYNNKNIPIADREELMTLIDITLTQNYFQFNTT